MPRDIGAFQELPKISRNKCVSLIPEKFLRPATVPVLRSRTWGVGGWGDGGGSCCSADGFQLEWKVAECGRTTSVLQSWFHFTALYLCAAWLLKVETFGRRLVLKSCSIECNLLSTSKETTYCLAEDGTKIKFDTGCYKQKAKAL